MENVLEDNLFEKRLGRRKLRESRSQSLGTKLTFDEERELEQAAQREGKTASEWAREVLLKEARRMKDDPLFTELVSVKLLLVNFLKPIAVGQKITLEQFAEIQTTIRKGKRKAAQEIMQQYTLPQGKEG